VISVLLTNDGESLPRWPAFGLVETNGNRLDQARVVVLDVPTRALTGHQAIPADG
jgi:hypothetical protein